MKLRVKTLTNARFINSNERRVEALGNEKRGFIEKQQRIVGKCSLNAVLKEKIRYALKRKEQET